MMNLPDEEVQQCMLAAYCSIYYAEARDDIFEDALSDYNADPEDCNLETLMGRDDDIEDLFD